MQELSYQEVSGVLAVPVGTVKSRVSRGRSLLREALLNFAREQGNNTFLTPENERASY